jgi:hypothetical protein
MNDLDVYEDLTLNSKQRAKMSLDIMIRRLKLETSLRQTCLVDDIILTTFDNASGDRFVLKALRMMRVLGVLFSLEYSYSAGVASIKTLKNESYWNRIYEYAIDIFGDDTPKDPLTLVMFIYKRWCLTRVEVIDDLLKFVPSQKVLNLLKC